VTISNSLVHGLFSTVDRNYVTAVRSFCRQSYSFLATPQEPKTGKQTELIQILFSLKTISKIILSLSLDRGLYIWHGYNPRDSQTNLQWQ